LSPGTEPSVEVFQRLLESDFGRIELAHGGGKPVFGEVVRVDLACRRDQLHRAHRRLVVPVGQHVDVGVRDSLAVQLARCLGQAAEGERAFVHQGAERFSEWFCAGSGHRFC
jgi:hypothetical protein